MENEEKERLLKTRSKLALDRDLIKKDSSLFVMNDYGDYKKLNFCSIYNKLIIDYFNEQIKIIDAKLGI